MKVFIVMGVAFRGGMWRTWPIRVFSTEKLAKEFIHTTKKAVAPDIQCLEIEGW